MALWQDYHRPATVAQALELLARYEGQARLIAGGTDLLLELQQGGGLPLPALIDIAAIPDLSSIRREGEFIEVGAATSHSHIVRSPLLRQHAPCLVESCGVIGGPQVRNVATLGGNVAHALPAADGTTALVALEAEARLVTAEGASWQPILSLFAGPGETTFDRGRALLTAFRFRVEADAGSAFSRIMRPQGVALPILACAAWLRLGHDGPRPRVAQARICLGPVAPTPCRAVQAEAALVGRGLEEGLDDCLAAARAALHPRSSKHRATAAYRQEMIEVLLRRTLPLAWERAGGPAVRVQGAGTEESSP